MGEGSMDDVGLSLPRRLSHVGGRRGVVQHHAPADGAAGEDVGGDDRRVQAVVAFEVDPLMHGVPAVITLNHCTGWVGCTMIRVPAANSWRQDSRIAARPRGGCCPGGCRRLPRLPDHTDIMPSRSARDRERRRRRFRPLRVVKIGLVMGSQVGWT